MLLRARCCLTKHANGTNVVNELDIPIICMGYKDMVIAASNDGILVADKDRSSHMKPLVEKIVDEVKFAEKSWGTYSVINGCSGWLYTLSK